MNEDNLRGTKYEGIRHGSPEWKRLTSTERSQYLTLAGGGLVGKRKPVTQADVDTAENAKLRENLMQEFPNETTKDDTAPGDIAPSDAARLGIPFTRIREVDGHRIGRDTRFGFWHVLDLPDLGKFTSLDEAKLGLMRYLENKKSDGVTPVASQRKEEQGQ